MEIIFGIYKKYWKKDPCQGAHTMSTRVGVRLPPGCAPYLLGPLVALRRKLQLHILAFEEKKIGEKVSSRFTIWSRRQALIFLGRADLESVRGFEKGNLSPSSSSTILHQQFHDAHNRE